MSAALKHDWWISPEEYLESEQISEVRHEYVNGVVYAMAGAKNRHNNIAGNVYGELFGALRGRPCQPFNSDTKVRIRRGSDTRFYYPDTMVVCEPNSPDDVFQDRPVVLFEVISESTARTDREEKLRAYQEIDTLQVYAILETDRIGITCYRRVGEAGEWTVESLKDPNAILSLPGIDCSLPVAALYARTDLL